MSSGVFKRFTSDPSDPSDPYVTDWTEAAKLTDEQIHAAALSDPDAPPATPEQLARTRRVVDIRQIREKFGLDQEQFALRFGLRLDMVQGWEDRTLAPDAAAITLLRVIWAEPDAVRRAVAAE